MSQIGTSAYDSLNRLTIAKNMNTLDSYCWTYDDFGNRTAYVTETGDNACPVPSYISPTVSYNAANQVTWVQNTAPVGFGYDASGNVTSDALNQYLYDAEGRVCAVEQSVAGVVSYTGYVYDAEGNRVAKGTLTSLSCNMSGNGFQQSSWYVLGQNGEQVSETDASGNWAHTNVFAGNQLIATYNTTGLHFQLSDWEGTRRVETDYAGNTQETCTNLPFGDGAPNCTAPTEQFFTGYQRDSESGNDYAQARYYASNMGRFITPDPYNGSYDINNPQSFNRYTYVNGNPLGFVDPSGLSTVTDACSITPNFIIFNNNGTYTQINNVTKIVGYAKQIDKNSCSSAMEAVGEAIAKFYIATGLSALSSQLSYSDYGSKATSVSAFLAYIQAAITVGCSIDYNSTACGAPQLAWLIPGGGGDVGKAIGDAFAVGAALCAAGTLGSNPACDAIALYGLANRVYGFLYDLFGWGEGPQFTGSLLPRPGVPGTQGSSSFGVPVRNLAIPDLPGYQPSNAAAQSQE